MALKVSLYVLVVFAILMFAGVSVGLAATHNGPYNVWTGKLPVDESACSLSLDPVVDKNGNDYTNTCFAALDGVRVTYKVDGGGPEPLYA